MYRIGRLTSSANAEGINSNAREVPTLRELAMNVCVKHIHEYTYLHMMSSEMFLELLSRLTKKLETGVLLRLERHNPLIVCEESDVMNWRIPVQEHMLRKYAPMPFQLREGVVNDLKPALISLIESGGSSAPKDIIVSAAEALASLTAMKMPVKLLEITGIGRVVGKLKKPGAAPEHLAKQAKDLVDKWRACVIAAAGEPPLVIGSFPQGKVSDQQMVEGGVVHKTWRDVYKYLAFVEEVKKRQLSQRAKELKAENITGKKRTIHGGTSQTKASMNMNSNSKPRLTHTAAHSNSSASKGGNIKPVTSTSPIKKSPVIEKSPVVQKPQLSAAQLNAEAVQRLFLL